MKQIIKVISDFVILLLVYGLIIYIDTNVEPAERGFFCDDKSLMYPHKDNTIPVPVLYIVSHGVPILFVIVSGMCCQKCETKMDLYRTIFSYLLGAGCLHLTANIVKINLGWLRPNFFEVCQPDMTSVYCSAGYVDYYKCNGHDVSKIRHSRLSFPSLHAAVSTYGMVFLIIYIQHCYIKDQKPYLFWKCVQGICLMWFSVTSVSRIADHKHHWADVIAGFFAGLMMATWVAYQWIPMQTNMEKSKDLQKDKMLETNKDLCKLFLEPPPDDTTRLQRRASL